MTPDGPIRPLSPRLAQVAALVRTGRTYRQIGTALGISKRTAERYVYIIADMLPGSLHEDLPPYRRVQNWAISHANPRTAEPEARNPAA